jgi:hypothetical protein
MNKGRTRSEVLARLRDIDINSEVGGTIEDYFDTDVVINDHVDVDFAVAVFERFLLSRILDNRSAALEALVIHGRFQGYEADAVLLHFAAREDETSQVIFESTSILRRMSDGGSLEAGRVLRVLEDDPYVRRVFGWYE